MMDALIEKIKDALDRECLEVHDNYCTDNDPKMLRHCWMCHKHDNQAVAVADALRDEMASPSQRIAALKG